MTHILSTLISLAIGLIPQEGDSFGASPEGAKALEIERAVLARPALKARVALQESTGGRAAAEKPCDLVIARPLLFRMQLDAPGDAGETLVSDGRFLVHAMVGDRRYQVQEVTPFLACAVLPPVIGFATLARPSDWFRPQEGLALVPPKEGSAPKEGSEIEELKVEVNGVLGLLRIGKQDHLPRALELDMTGPDGGRATFSARVASLELGDPPPRSTFLYDVPDGFAEEAGEGEGVDARLLPAGTPIPPGRLDGSGPAARVIVFWFSGGKESEAQLELVAPIAAQAGARLCPVHCGDPGPAVDERVARLGKGVAALQETPGAESLVAAFHVAVYPTTYVIAADGKVIDRFVGKNRDRVQRALKERKG